MSWDKGFNFRGSSGYVTDGANETYVINDVYPTTRNGVTFGWDGSSIGFLDRNAGLDRRLAGADYNSATGTAAVFRIDLPEAGTYAISLAIGDASGGHDAMRVQIQDTTVDVLDLLATTAAGEFYDATGTIYSAANWVTTQAAVSKAFATTILKMRMSTTAVYWTVAHLRITELAMVGGPTRMTLMGVG